MERAKVQGVSKKTEFSEYAGCDGCDGPMEGGRGLKKIIFNLYIQIQKYNLFKYTNTLKYAHKYSLNLRKNEKSKFLKISFKLSLWGAGFLRR